MLIVSPNWQWAIGTNFETRIVLKIQDLADWADSKSCAPHRQGKSCDHEACSINDEALALIRSLRRVDLIAPNMTNLNGWIIDD